jgi:hypothetical protein
MTLLIEWPWLALLPAALLLVAYSTTKRRIVLATSVAWLLYTVYEYGMKRRWLCTGECNIRVDLLLLYPVLVVMTVIAAVAAFRRRPSR